MYKITVISSSKKKSLKSERLILDKYGFRLSPKSWSLNISDIGLKLLISELNQKANKYTNLKILNKGQILYSIGNNKNYLFSPISIKQFNSKKNKLLNIISELHDLGKKTTFFQELMKNKSNTKDQYLNLIRHEYLTIFIIEYILLTSKYNLNISFKDFTIKKLDLSTIFLKKDHINKFFNLTLENDLLSKNQKDILLIAALHHITPEKDNNNVYIRNLKDIKDFKGIRNLKDNENLKGIKALKFILQNSKIEFNFLLNKEEINNINSQIEYLKDIKISKKEFIDLRSSLIVGDHIGSSIIISNPEERFKKSKMHAKSLKNNYQTYKEHISLVKKYTKFSYKIFNQELQPFNTYSIFKPEFIHEKSELSNYQWQKESIDFIENNFNKFIPSLTFLSAGTGKGKTLFAMKMNALISKNKRLTVLNSLRSLTLQAGTEYKNIKFFNDNDIGVLIGSEEVDNIYKVDNEELEKDINFNVYTNESISKGFYKKSFGNYLSSNNNKFLNTPVLITTVDSLIKATDIRRNAYAKILMRLITSDIIIDEPDSFSSEDQQNIIHLLYLAGLYGVNVTISTATTIPALVNSYHEAYSNGIRESKYNDFNLAFLGDVCNTINKKSKDFIPKTLGILKNNVSLKKGVKFVDIDINGSNLMETIEEAHCNNNEDGLSCGLIRVSTIKHARKLSKKIEKQYKNLDIEVILYHSSFPLLERSYIEYELNNLLTRKNEKLKDKKLFKEFNNKTDKDKTIVVVATGLIEVGRDFDFDWAIVEPASSRSVVQTAGRVYRHRTDFLNNEKKSKLYIFIIKEPFELIEIKNQEKERAVYKYPGFEDNEHIFKIEKNIEDKIEYKRDFESLVNKSINETDKYNTLVTVFDIIECKDNTIQYMENNVIKCKLKNILNNLNLEDCFQNSNEISENGGIYSKFRKGSNKSDMYLKYRKNKELSLISNSEKYYIIIKEKNETFVNQILKNYKDYFNKHISSENFDTNKVFIKEDRFFHVQLIESEKGFYSYSELSGIYFDIDN